MLERIKPRYSKSSVCDEQPAIDQYPENVENIFKNIAASDMIYRNINCSETILEAKHFHNCLILVLV